MGSVKVAYMWFGGSEPVKMGARRGGWGGSHIKKILFGLIICLI